MEQKQSYTRQVRTVLCLEKLQMSGQQRRIGLAVRNYKSLWIRLTNIPEQGSCFAVLSGPCFLGASCMRVSACCLHKKCHKTASVGSRQLGAGQQQKNSRRYLLSHRQAKLRGEVSSYLLMDGSVLDRQTQCKNRRQASSLK
jgi:hypothetical protein